MINLCCMMDFLSNLACIIILALVFILLVHHLNKNRNLPLVGLLPELIFNLYKFHDKVAQLLEERKGTFLHKGAWVGQMNMLFTSDPANVRHIMSANFSNYLKGPEWRKRFDIFGDHSLFNSDFDEWKHQRKVVRAFLSHQQLNQHVAKIIPDIIEKNFVKIKRDLMLNALTSYLTPHEIVGQISTYFKCYDSRTDFRD